MSRITAIELLPVYCSPDTWYVEVSTDGEAVTLHVHPSRAEAARADLSAYPDPPNMALDWGRVSKGRISNESNERLEPLHGPLLPLARQCPKCPLSKQAPHPCPYANMDGGDDGERCECCGVCEGQCADDI